MNEEKTITVGHTSCAGRRRSWLRKLFAICLVLGLSLTAGLSLALALRPAVGVQAINASLAPARISPDFQAQRLNLNVNYGHDWVEGNYEAGHTMWITLTEAVMILSPGLYQALPVPIVAPTLYGGIGAAWNDGAVEFDASESHHTDPTHEIVLFQWDFGDGSPVMTTTNSTATHTYSTRGIYLATLTVWDDAASSTTRATQVNVTAPDSPPVADPGGPYSSLPGQGVVLDGSASYDPDEGLGDAVTLYEWDIAGNKRTATGPTLVYTGTVTATLPITLRVKDRGADYGLDSPQWSEPVTTALIVGGETPSPPEEKAAQGAAWLVWVVVAISLIIVAAFLIPRAVKRLRV